MEISRNLFVILFLIDSFKTINHKTRLQKLIFIAKEKFGYKASFNFIPYLYGPYSFELADFV
jgi:uncharacterized protein YwgA